jgi:hypothetical protein
MFTKTKKTQPAEKTLYAQYIKKTKKTIHNINKEVIWDSGYIVGTICGCVSYYCCCINGYFFQGFSKGYYDEAVRE